VTGDGDLPGPLRSSVGILISDNRRRGAEVQAERTVEGLRSLGWDTEFRSLAFSQGPTVDARPLVTVERDDLGRFNPSLVAPTRRFLGRHAHGVVLAWGSLSVRYVAIAALGLRDRPRIGSVSIGSPLAWVGSRLAMARYRLIAGRFDFVIAISDRIRDELVDAVGIPSSRVTVIRSGIPDRFFDIEQGEHAGPIRILFVGSLSDEKDPAAAVEAFEIAARETELRLRVVGEGPMRAMLQDLVMRRNLADSVEFTGAVDDVAPHLGWADILLSTSRTEGVPGALIEGAAAGRPAVAYGVGAVEEVVEDGSSGIVVRERSVESAARALVTLAGDRALRRRLGERARLIAGERFLMASAVEQTDRLLRDQLV
jgi:glycosyltransferase involved in cell wall biosynthesis